MGCPVMSEAKSTVRAAVQAASGDLVALSHWVHQHPEVGWQEHESCAHIVAFLRARGFTVTTPVAGLDTAFHASVGSGDLHVALFAEYDALPGLGHACGHNIIASASVGAGVALATVAETLGLTVSVFGTPAEEGAGGKIVMLNAGAFDGVDVAALVHPGPVDVDHGRPFAVRHLDVTYTGKAAHAAAYPERGVNAADAMTVAQVAIGLLRQQLAPTTRVHGIVTRGGEAPNAIAQRVEGKWYARADTMAELDALYPRIAACFQAGAIATGATVDIHEDSEPYSDLVNHEALTAAYRANAEALGRRFDAPEPLTRMNRASTDMGNVSYRIAVFHPYIGVNSGDAVNHQHEFAAACVTPDADRAVVDGAAALAMTMVDVATDPALRTLVTGYSRR